MKKYKGILLFVLFISLFINSTVYVYANNYETDVVLKEIYDPNEEYNYDLTWDNMIFTYTESKSFVYNEETHEYDLNYNEYWSDGNNKVNVVNNAYKKIDVSLAYKSQEQYDNIVGKFSPNSFRLYHGDGKEAKLSLYGKIDNKDTNTFTIGTITIRIQ